MQLRMALKISMGMAIMSGLLVLGMSSLVYYVSKTSFEAQIFKQLVAIRDMKQRQVATYFNFIKDQCLMMAQDPFVIQACKEFNEATKKITEELKLNEQQLEEYKKGLIDYYQNQFLPRLNKNLGQPKTVEDFIPPAEKDIILQNIYIVQNPNPVGEKDKLVSVSNTSMYGKIHAVYHPFFKNYLQKFQYYDIFLIDQKMNVIYSVFKEIDFSNYLNERALKDSNLYQLVLHVQEEQDKQEVFLVDFAPYDPSYAAPAGFVAVPVYDGNKKIGTLAMQLPLNTITSIMTDDNHWYEMGLGRTGESYLVGKDYRMRSIARLLVEDPQQYYKILLDSGTPAQTVERIKIYKTSVFLQEIVTKPIEEIVQNEKGTMYNTDYRGKEVLSAYAPLTINELQWGIECKIDRDEVLEPLWTLVKQLIVMSMLAIVAMTAVAFFLLWWLFDDQHSVQPPTNIK